MTRMQWAAVGLAAAAAVVTARPHAQAPPPGLRTIVPESIGAMRDWDNAVNRMLRTDELRLRQRRDDTLVASRTVEQLTQYYKGVRVWGGAVARALDGAGSAISVFGTVYQGLDLDVTPGLDRDAAAAALSARGSLLVPGTEPELVVLPGGGGAYGLAWVGQVFTGSDVVRFFLDAKTGAVVRRYTMLQRQAPGTIISGVGVLGDEKKVSVTPSGGTFIASDSLRPPVIRTYSMRGDIDRTFSVLFNVTTLNPSDIASDTASAWADTAVVDAHAYSAYTYDYYFKRFGRRGLDNANRSLLNIVHPVRRSDIFDAPSDVFGLFYVNAFFCADCAGGIMMYGEGLPPGFYLSGSGQHWDFVAGALDIVGHELTHGVTAYTSNLEYVNESGALNEAFSDIMGTSIEFFFQKPGSGPLKADYLMGEDVVVPDQPGSLSGIRSLADPAMFGDPDHYTKRSILPADDEHDNGGVHVNSTIPSHAFYLAVEGGTNRTSGLRVQGVGSANREQIERVFYRAFAQLMPSNATFSVARAVTLQAAQDLYGGGSAAFIAVRDAWTAVGVN